MTVVNHTRGELYEKYKKTDPELAGKFFKDEELLWIMAHSGAMLSTVGIGTAIATLLFFGVAGIIPGHPVVFAFEGAICGPIASLGLITLAIWYCKRRNMLAERLSVADINAIAGKILIDPNKRFSSL